MKTATLDLTGKFTKDMLARLDKAERQRDALLAQLRRISERDPQSRTCGPDSPELCENGCIGCIARAAIATCEDQP